MLMTGPVVMKAHRQEQADQGRHQRKRSTPFSGMRGNGGRPDSGNTGMAGGADQSAAGWLPGRIRQVGGIGKWVPDRARGSKLMAANMASHHHRPEGDGGGPGLRAMP